MNEINVLVEIELLNIEEETHLSPTFTAPQSGTYTISSSNNPIIKTSAGFIPRGCGIAASGIQGMLDTYAGLHVNQRQLFPLSYVKNFQDSIERVWVPIKENPFMFQELNKEQFKRYILDTELENLLTKE